jgi:DNA polymerase-1
MTTLLIDGDPIAYQCSFSNQSSYDWGDDGLDVTHDPDAAVADVDLAIKKIKSDLGVKNAVVALSVATPLGWRRAVLPTYKDHRKKIAKPLALEACRQHLLSKWKAYIRPTLEADDVLGILATNRKIVPGEKIIVSIDKDLLQIPSKVYRPREQKLVHVTREEADYLHLRQTLTGDTVDGYTGLPGCGPKGADKVLAAYGAEWSTVVTAYEAKGLTEADALVQARVARICRASDYDFKLKKVKLWEPKTQP